MKRNVISTYLTDDEVGVITEIKKSTKWNQTEIASFFVRRGMKDYSKDMVKNIDNDIAEQLVVASFNEYKKTDTFKKEIEKAINDKIKERENAGTKK